MYLILNTTHDIESQSSHVFGDVFPFRVGTPSGLFNERRDSASQNLTKIIESNRLYWQRYLAILTVGVHNIIYLI